MRAIAYPNCCGGVIFSKFGNTIHGDEPQDFSVKEANEFLLENEAIWRNRSFAMIVMNHQQVEKFKNLLKRRDYSCIAEKIYHPSHKSRINIYLKSFYKY